MALEVGDLAESVYGAPTNRTHLNPLSPLRIALRIDLVRGVGFYFDTFYFKKYIVPLLQ